MAGELDPRAAGGKRLQDKVCIVTGSGQGIGRATARRLGEEGGTIVVADRVDESASRTVSELQENGVEAMKVLADVGSLTGAQELMSQAVDRYGRIDVLVNNVGGTIWPSPTTNTPKSRSITSWSAPCIPPCGVAWRSCRS